MDIAIDAKSSDVGFGFTAQSANSKSPSFPNLESGTIIINELDTTDAPGAVFNYLKSWSLKDLL